LLVPPMKWGGMKKEEEEGGWNAFKDKNGNMGKRKESKSLKRKEHTQSKVK